VIRLGKPSDNADTKVLTEACAVHMQQQGIEQWNEYYPSLAILTKDLMAGDAYVYIQDGRLVGTVMFSQDKDPLYNPIQWSTPDAAAYYVHRLAVHPDYQGQGIAKALMDFVEGKIQQSGGSAVRLDTFSQNPRNNKFYKARGYTQLGDIYFANKSPYPFHCFEKVFRKENP